MIISKELLEYHRVCAIEAAGAYKEGLSASSSAEDWRAANVEARRLVVETLRATAHLREVAPAISKSAAHVVVLRRLLAPPTSQDQFKLLCPEYSKDLENNGRQMPLARATALAVTFEQWRDRRITRWLSSSRSPTRRELERIIGSVSPLIADQMAGTLRRKRMSAAQENAVIHLLLKNGWKQIAAKKIDEKGDIPAKHFVHKTRFATQARPQEVDIACGLGGTAVLAMECKVTNDETNSIKRINDVLKKAAAWQKHWGSFVKTAALLQGVIAPKEIENLLEANVEVFWSHRLEMFETWLAERVGESS